MHIMQPCLQKIGQKKKNCSSSFSCPNYQFHTCMSLTMSNNSNSAHVASSNNHSEISSVKLDKVNDLTTLDFNYHSVVQRDKRVRITDGTTIMGNKVGNTLGASGHASHLTKLVLQSQTKKGASPKSYVTHHNWLLWTCVALKHNHV